MDSKRLVRLFEMIFALPFRDVKTFLVYCCSEREKAALLVYNIVNSMIGEKLRRGQEKKNVL